MRYVSSGSVGANPEKPLNLAKNNKSGAVSGAAFVLVPREGASCFTLDLRNVVAQRGENHIINGLGADREATGGHAASAGPSILR